MHLRWAPPIALFYCLFRKDELWRLNIRIPGIRLPVSFKTERDIFQKLFVNPICVAADVFQCHRVTFGEKEGGWSYRKGREGGFRGIWQPPGVLGKPALTFLMNKGQLPCVAKCLQTDVNHFNLVTVTDFWLILESMTGLQLQIWTTQLGK